MYKPVLASLALPPVPLLAVALWAGWRLRRGRGDGWLWLWLCLAGLWLASCQGTAIFLQDHVLKVPAPLDATQRQALANLGASAGATPVHRGAAKGAVPMAEARRPVPVAVIVLGGGLQPLAPEYGMSALSIHSMERLRYGIWLSREIHAPIGFSGGVGWAQKGPADGPTEAEIADRVARQEYGVSLRWVESGSADTAENADRTVALLGEQGVTELVLVSHAFHLPRARRLFEAAARHWADTHPGSTAIHVTPAGTGYWRHEVRPALEWLPSGTGAWMVSAALHEGLGMLLATGR